MPQGIKRDRRPDTSDLDTNHTEKKVPKNPRKPDKVQERKRQRVRTRGTGTGEEISNAQLAEFLAGQAEDARPKSYPRNLSVESVWEFLHGPTWLHAHGTESD